MRAVDGLSYAVPRARTVGADRRVGLRQDGQLARDHRAAARDARVTGSIRFEGQELLGLPERKMRTASRGSQIAMVFQDPARSLNPTMRIGAQITEAIQPARRRVARRRRTTARWS